MQLTVRDVDDELHAHLKHQAQKADMSVNRYVLRMLRESAGLGATHDRDVRYHDLDHLAGTWRAADWEEFTAHLDEQRGIDAEMWA
jgi:hypothetical protein